jgi:transglutaminase-like putative cysteine protease
MLIRVGYDIVYEFPSPTATALLLNVLPDRQSDLCHPDEIKLEPALAREEFIDCFGNRCLRFLAPAGTLRVTNDTIVRDPGLPEPAFPDAVQHAVEDLPAACLQFLLPSRYCEVDRLIDIAWELFADTPAGWPRVQAIRDWVHNHIEFGYQYARSTKTAFDVYQEKRGVCRDFTHLAITFCRAMNIPTRYATGYLGDIGVPPDPAPMDFNACFQVYLGGAWHTFDARHKERRIGWILIATGRDAADCAFTTTFGAHKLERFIVWTEEVTSVDLARAITSAPVAADVQGTQVGSPTT